MEIRGAKPELNRGLSARAAVLFKRIFGGSSRGAGYVEYLLIAAFGGLALILMFQRFRAKENVLIRNQSKTVAALDAPNPQDVIAALGGYEDYTERLTCTGDVCMIPGQCFAAGTLVATEGGDRPIETVQVGDKVWSRSPVTKTIELHPVVRLFVHRSFVIDLQVGHDALRGETLKVTPNHPFWVDGRGWTRADALAESTLWSPDGLMAATGRVGWSEPTTVYNFEVEGAHTYLVGRAHVLVHNANDPPEMCPGDPNDPLSPAGMAVRWEKYRARGGTLPYDEWAKRLATAVNNARQGNARQQWYADQLGGSSKILDTPLGPRQVDVVLISPLNDRKVAVEIKTGKESLTTTGKTPNADAIKRDAWLAANGYDVVWVLEKGGSAPLIAELEKNGIKVIIGPTTAADILAKAAGSPSNPPTPPP